MTKKQSAGDEPMQKKDTAKKCTDLDDDYISYPWESCLSFLPDAGQMKELDAHTIRDLGILSPVLMERAALSVYERIRSLRLSKKVDPNKAILIVCKSGNNGADGLALARMLIQDGADVYVHLAGASKRRSPEYAMQLASLKKILTEYGREEGRIWEDENDPSLSFSIIVDAMFGVGLSRPLSSEDAALVGKLNRMDAYRIAVDIPSGILAGTGQLAGDIAFRANETVTFACAKPGLFLYPGAKYSGHIYVADIGISLRPLAKDRRVICTADVDDLAALLPARPSDSHKGTNGKILLIAGCREMSGAAYLAALGAYMAGAGYVRIYTHTANKDVLRSALPEALISVYDTWNETELDRLLDGCDVVCIGSGIGRSEDAARIVSHVLTCATCPVILDGDGLYFVACDQALLHARPNRSLILTPHILEMSRLCHLTAKEIKADPVGAVYRFADVLPHVTLVLKDARSYIYQNGRRLFLHTGGTDAMAKAGSGDVLAGIIAALTAAGCPPYEAGILGVCLHGAGGVEAWKEKGNYAVMASDTARCAGKVMGRLLQKRKETDRSISHGA